MYKYIRHIYLLGAIISLLIGGSIAYMGNNADSAMLIVAGFIFLVGGVVLIVIRHKTSSIDYEPAQVKIEGEAGEAREAIVKKVSNEKGKILINSLNIYPDEVKFENTYNPIGLPWKCLNDGKEYYVHDWDPKQNKLVAFTLPDDDENKMYYDPAEFANPVTMPSYKKYLTSSMTTMQKISVGLLLICIVGELIGIVAVGG